MMTKLNLYFLRSTTFKINKVGKINIKYGDMQIKQHSKVKYLGCMLWWNNVSGKAIRQLSVINKINNKLKFLTAKNRFFTPTLRQLLCNALIQPHFNYAFCFWYSIQLTKKLKKQNPDLERMLTFLPAVR